MVVGASSLRASGSSGASMAIITSCTKDLVRPDRYTVTPARTPPGSGPGYVGAAALIRGLPPTATSRLHTTPKWYISSSMMRRISRAASAPRSLMDHQPQRYGGMVDSSSSTASCSADLSQSTPRSASGMASRRATEARGHGSDGPLWGRAAEAGAAVAVADAPAVTTAVARKVLRLNGA